MSMFILFPAVGADHGRIQLIQAGAGTTTASELVERMRQCAADLDAHPPPTPPAPPTAGPRGSHPSPRYSSLSLGGVSGENLVRAVNANVVTRSHLKTKKQAEEDAARERSRYRQQRRQRTKGE
jgi:hypothetical protein